MYNANLMAGALYGSNRIETISGFFKDSLKIMRKRFSYSSTDKFLETKAEADKHEQLSAANENADLNDTTEPAKKINSRINYWV